MECKDVNFITKARKFNKTISIISVSSNSLTIKIFTSILNVILEDNDSSVKKIIFESRK